MGICQGRIIEKYTEELQIKCRDFEKKLGLWNVDFADFEKSLEEKAEGYDKEEYLINFFEKIGLKEKYLDINTKLKEVVLEIFKETKMNYLIFFGMLLCGGKKESKCNRFIKELTKKDPNAKDIAEKEFKSVLSEIMKIPVKIIPKYAGVEKVFDEIDFAEHVRNWWRRPLIDTISIEDIKKWFNKEKFTPEEARDAGLKHLIHEIPKTEQMPEDVESKIKQEKPKPLRKLQPAEILKKCADVENKLRLNSVSFQDLMEAAEYYNPTKEKVNALQEEELKKVMKKVRLSPEFANPDTKLKDFLTEYLKKVYTEHNKYPGDAVYKSIAEIAFLYCGGDYEERADEMCAFINFRDNAKDWVLGDTLKGFLRAELDLAVNFMPKFVDKNCKDFEKANVDALVEEWWGGDFERHILKSQLKAWIKKEKFTAKAAREMALLDIQENAEPVVPKTEENATS
jgi:hypothetical protein